MSHERICIRGVRSLGRHGFEHEREHPQPFDVSAELFVNASAAIADDDLEKTIDYGLVVQDIRRVVEQESYHLLESLADAIAGRLLGYGAARVTVTVSKPQVALALGIEEIAVTVERPKA